MCYLFCENIIYIAHNKYLIMQVLDDEIFVKNVIYNNELLIVILMIELKFFY